MHGGLTVLVLAEDFLQSSVPIRQLRHVRCEGAVLLLHVLVQTFQNLGRPNETGGRRKGGGDIAVFTKSRRRFH